MRYGVPYQGSKNRIAEWVVYNLPAADTLVDLFAGGCAVTHAAMLSKKYENFIVNDLQDAPQLFTDAVNGKYRTETRWISREDFFRLRESDAYVSICFSFNNNRTSYLYSQKIEPYKKACHYAIVFDDWRDMERLCPETVSAAQEALHGLTDTYERRLALGLSIVKWLKANGTQEMVDENPLYSSCRVKRDTPSRKKGTYRNLQSLESLQNLESLESLERLERLQSLQSLQRLQSLERLESLQKDYREVDIPDNAIVYADPPYRGTTQTGYLCENSFAYAEFDTWLEKCGHPVIVSEYTCPKNCVQIAETPLFSGMGRSVRTERLFIHQKWREWYREHQTQPTLF